MATAPPSTKGKSSGSAADGVLAPGAGSHAPTTTGSRPRRRPIVLPGAIAGAILAGTYGHLVLGMRFGPPLVMVALGGLTLVLGAAALWRVVDPLTRGEVILAPETRAPHRIRELEREKQAVLKAIKEIELDYQMRKISEADYREMVERYRARALRVMGDLAVGDDYRALIERELKDRLSVRAVASAAEGKNKNTDTSTGPPDTAIKTKTTSDPGPSGTEGPPATAACVACATLNDGDAQFCKRCGQKMNSPVARG